MNNKEFEFKVGDIVGHVLWDGEFELKENRNDVTKDIYPLCFRDKHGVGISLVVNGKEVTSHDKPSIYLIRRPKKMIEKKIEFFANVYKECIHEHDSEEICKMFDNGNCLNPDNKKVIVTCFVEEQNERIKN